MADGRNPKFERCIAIVLRHEGGFVADPRDPGGATNMGITRATLADWRGGEVTVDDVRALTETEAREIYLALYWNPVRGDDLPHGVDLAVLDFAVHAGVRRAARTLQHVLGVTEDGVIGRETLGAARRADRASVIDGLCDLRLRHLRGLAHWTTYARGWTRRVEEVRAAAHEMARRGLPLAEAARTDTVRASTAAAASVAGAAALIQEIAPAVQALAPVLDRLGPAGLVALAAALAVAGVVMWRRRRA
jgi:lysozyme family protein